MVACEPCIARDTQSTLSTTGQGTIGLEVLKQMNGKPLDAIFVCCGGGGMLAGIAAYVKRVRPQVMVIGVEAEDGTLKPP